MYSVLKPLFLGIFLLLPPFALLPTAQADDDYGRYRAIVLQEGGASAGRGSLTPRVFLIDSKEGHFWIWERNVSLGGQDKQGFGTILTYEGRLKPGKEAGEVIFQNQNNP